MDHPEMTHVESQDTRTLPTTMSSETRLIAGYTKPRSLHLPCLTPPLSQLPRLQAVISGLVTSCP